MEEKSYIKPTTSAEDRLPEGQEVIETVGVRRVQLFAGIADEVERVGQIRREEGAEDRELFIRRPSVFGDVQVVPPYPSLGSLRER